MGTAALRAAEVQETYRPNGMNTLQVPPSSTSTDIVKGCPVVLSSGAVAAAALSSYKVTDANTLFAITNEPFRKDQYAAGSVPIRQTTVGVTILTPSMPIEVNFYHDGDGDADDAPAQAALGSLVLLLNIAALGIYVANDGSTSGCATFRVIGFVDPPGTIYGRILVVPTSGFRLVA